MTDPRHDLHKNKFKEKDLSLKVDVTESLLSAMSKIPNLKNTDLESEVEQSSKDSSNEWVPFVELGAFNKLLSILKPDCLKFTESTEASLTEVISRLKYLLEFWNSDHKKIKNILSNDNTLIKCDQCGVISLRKRKKSKACEKGTRTFITQNYLPRSPTERYKSVSNPKVHEGRFKLIQKDDKRNSFFNVSREMERNKRYSESNIKSNSNFCATSCPERQINSIILNEETIDEENNEKNNVRKFDKYSDRPVIHVDAPSRKLPNIPKSKAKLAQFVLNRKLNQKKMENIGKKNKIGNDEDDSITGIVDEADLEKVINNVTENVKEVLKITESKNNVEDDFHAKKESPRESNSESSVEKRSDVETNSRKEILHDQNEFQKGDEKYLKKGDSSYFPKKKSFPHLPPVEGSYLHPLGGPDVNLKLKPTNWVSSDDNQKEEISCENSLNEKKVLLSQIEEGETTVLHSSSEENSVEEWMNASLKKKKILSKKKVKKFQEEKNSRRRNFLKKFKSAKKTLQTIGMQTINYSSSSLHKQKQVAETNDKFIDSKLSEKTIEVSENRILLLHEKSLSDHQSSFRTNGKTSNISATSIKLNKTESKLSKKFEEQKASENLQICMNDSTSSIRKNSCKISFHCKKILEGEEEIHWKTFEQLVETLNSPQRKLWKDICSVVRNETRRASGTEVYVEVKPITKETKKIENKSPKDADEISFEMDMPLKNLEDFLGKQGKSCLLDRNEKL